MLVDRTNERVCGALIYQVMTPRLGFDLSLRQAHRYTGERMALAGDAAHTVRQGKADAFSIVVVVVVVVWRCLCVTSSVHPSVRPSIISVDYCAATYAGLFKCRGNVFCCAAVV